MDALEVEMARLRGLPAELDRIREDAAETRALATMADRDASEVRTALRAHTQALTVLRETQVEQGHTLQTIAEVVGGLAVGQERHEELLDRYTATLDQHTATLNGHTATLDQHTATLDGHTTALQTLVEGQQALVEGQARTERRLAELTEARRSD